MSYSIVSLLLIQIILIALNAVFASAELAVLSVNESRINRLAEQGSKKARRLRKLTKEPAKFLSTIQIAITLSGFLGSAFAADGFSDPLVDWLISLGVTLPRNTLDTLSVIFITLVLSYFTLIFGELVPKRIAMKKAEALSLKVSGIVSGISILFKPIVWLLSVSTNAVLKMLGIDPDEAEAHICEEDIRMMVETGGETGAIDKDEQNFIQNVFKFDDLSAGKILTHRTGLIMLWLEDTDDTWEKIICSSSFSRYPVCDGSPDKVVGVLNAKVYLREKDRSRENVMRSALEPAYFVPETVKADVLFRNMKQTHTTFAFVLDEYGGLTGIVTMHDLIEELVGEIWDEHDEVEEDFEKLGENIYRVDCSVSLEDFMEFFDIKLESDSVSVGGWVMEQLNRVPVKGESFHVQHLEITVSELSAYRVSSIIIKQCDSILECAQ